MKKSKIYTRGGDKGETSLVSGERTSKSSESVDLYGDVDELNSSIGYSLTLIGSNHFLENEIKILLEVQYNLFNLGSRLACNPDMWEKYKLAQVDESLIVKIENSIDKLDSEMPSLKYFILPGGVPSAAYLHLTRTFCRKVERKLVLFGRENQIPENSIELLNRLSDYLFVVSRYINFKENKSETFWKN